LVVEAYGFEYDFQSIMHYRLASFAVVPGTPTMWPRNMSVNPMEVGISRQLSPLDIKKLNKAYNCDGKAPAKCGGAVASPTGGDINGDPMPGENGCEFYFATDADKGIELNLKIQWMGGCTTDFLEVRVGNSKGPIIGRFCKDQPFRGLRVPAHGVWMHWRTSGSDLKGRWTTYKVVCDCPELFMQSVSNLYGIWKLQNETWKGKPVYISINNDLMLTGEPQFWQISGAWPPGTKASLPPNPRMLFAINQLPYVCPTDLSTGWQMYNQELNKFAPLFPWMSARCKNCKLTPQFEECADCCGKITLSSKALIIQQAMPLGEYALFNPPEFRGKPVYQFTGNPTICLKSVIGDSWTLGFCSPLSSNLTIAQGDRALCPRFTKGFEWRFYVNGTWYMDQSFRITCGDAPAMTTMAPTGKCLECKTVKEGPLRGEYYLQNSRDPRCSTDGCVYTRPGSNELYCFEDGGYAVDLGCAATG